MHPEVVRQPQPRVLFVGIDDPFGTTLEHELRARDLAVERAAGGRAALARWADPPDVVILALEGGDMDALEFAQAVPSANRPPLIACTRARAAAGIPPDALGELGIDVVIARPCHVDVLGDAVDSALGRGRVALPQTA